MALAALLVLAFILCVAITLEPARGFDLRGLRRIRQRHFARLFGGHELHVITIHIAGDAKIKRAGG